MFGHTASKRDIFVKGRAQYSRAQCAQYSGRAHNTAAARTIHPPRARYSEWRARHERLVAAKLPGLPTFPVGKFFPFPPMFNLYPIQLDDAEKPGLTIQCKLDTKDYSKQARKESHS